MSALMVRTNEGYGLQRQGGKVECDRDERGSRRERNTETCWKIGRVQFFYLREGSTSMERGISMMVHGCARGRIPFW
jgi:hypothetical protein